MFTRLKNLPMHLGFLMVFAAFVALAPSGASAAESIRVSGEVAGGGTFEGVVEEPAFTSEFAQIRFSGQLEGVVVVDGLETAIIQQFEVSAVISDRSDCQTLFYSADPIMVDAIGDEIQLDQVTKTKPRSSLLGGLLGGDAFCVISDLAGDDEGNIDRVVDLLNDLLGN